MLPNFVRNAVLAASLVLFYAAASQAQLNFQMPQPSGEFGIGRTAFDWTNRALNADNALDSAHSEPDELMVYLWYPTIKTAAGAKGNLFPGAKEIDVAPDTIPGFKNGPIFGGNWTKVVSGEIPSHAINDARIALKPKAFPVVVFTPASFGTCFEYSSAIEDLVSHGYVVASIEHTYETFAVAFPGGQVRTVPTRAIQQRYLAALGSSAEESYDKLAAWNRHRVDFRANEISFVLDKLSELNSGDSQFSRRLDVHKVAVVGHSRGGWAAILSCRRDHRFRACVSLDGANDGEGLNYPGSPVPTQPILYVEIAKTMELPDGWMPLKKAHLTAAEWVQRWHQTVDREFHRFPAGGYFVELKQSGLEHYSFSDRPVLLALREQKNADTAIKQLNLTENITRRFLDRHLKGDTSVVVESTPDIVVHRYL